MSSSIVWDSGALRVSTPFDRGFLNDFKRTIPATERAPKKIGKKFYWMVDPKRGADVQELIKLHFGDDVAVPVGGPSPKSTQQIIEIRYIGRTKDRGDGNEPSAFGYYDKGWNVVIPESVLIEWFTGVIADAGPQRTLDTRNLYAVLGVKRTASETDIKGGYRRMAKQWHPDVCKEPDAREQFERIQQAYEILSDPNTKTRYDVGLQLELGVMTDDYRQGFGVLGQQPGYRPPLRCGMLIVEGTPRIGRLYVSKILAWEDIKDQNNKTLVVSWQYGKDTWDEIWV